MNQKLIYIADDEVNICNIIRSFLMKEGFAVQTFHDGRSILDAFRKKNADLLIMDIMMPEMDGFSLCSAIRELSSVPIIIVSARDSETDRIIGLNLGSDDYLTKPFSPMELVARVKSIFRRIELDTRNNSGTHPVLAADVVFYPDRRAAECKGKNLNLTVMEFNLMLYLASNKNRAISREELLNKVWGFESDTGTRATDDMIKRIRSKLLDAGSNLTIETVWGYGFRIAGDDED